MYLYNILAVVVYYILIYLLIPNRRWRINSFVAFSAVHLVLFHALRDPYIYPDNSTYALAFETISTFSFKETVFQSNPWISWEKGYLALNWLLSNISNNPELLFISVSIFIVAGLIWFYYKTSYMILISILLYMLYGVLFYQSLFVLRQHIACVLILMALYYIKRKVVSIFLFIAAILMHYSAIIVLPFIFFRRIDVRKLFSVKVFVIAVLGLFLFKILIGKVLSLIPRFSIYTDVENNIVPIAILGSLYVLHFINKTYRYVDNEKDLDILSFFVYGTICSVCVIGLPGGGRLSNYFMYIMPVVYPMLFKYNKRELFVKLFYSFFFWCLIFYLFFVLLNSSGENGLDNYRFFWNGMGYVI